MKKIVFLIAFIGLSFAVTSQQTITATITHDALQREYILYVPANYTGSAAVPLVFNFHGYGSNATEQMWYGDFRSIADTANFIIVHPNGMLDGNGTTHFNVGWGGSTIDDVGFTGALLDSISADYNINADRIYSTGMSNGGFMSYHLACQLSDKIAAIASVTGSMSPVTYNACNPQHPTAILEIHGTSDGTVPYTGASFSKPVSDVLDYWVNFNNSNTTPTVINVPDINTSDGSTVEHLLYYGGDNDVTVEHFKITGGGHTWSGSAFGGAGTNYDIDASVEVWKFFMRYDINGLIKLILVQSSTNATCGNSNGSATVDVTGNEGPVISYLWDDTGAQTTQTATGLIAGNYSVIVTDSAGNTNTSVVTVINSNQPTVSINEDAQISCNGETDASITAIVSGGTPTFSYSWDDEANQTTATATGLGEGIYTVTVEDGANCLETITITLTEPTQLSSSYGINGNTATPSNGVITVIPNGGTPPYSYDWDNGGTTAINDGLFQGDYTLTLSDANGCTTITTYTVGGNVDINASFSNKFIGKVYPNPSNGKFQLHLLNINEGRYTIELTNTIGQVLNSQSIEIISNETKIEFNSEGFAKGVYLLNLSANGLLLKSYRVGME